LKRVIVCPAMGRAHNFVAFTLKGGCPLKLGR